MKIRLISKIFFILFISSTLLAQSKENKEIYDTTGPAVLFEFKYNKGDLYRILSTVNEDVYVNSMMDHKSVIINRVSAEVTDLDEDGNGIHDVSFMTTEKSTGSYTGKNFTWGEEYKSIFKRDKRGIYTISNEYFMPTVRDVPCFPKKEIKPGESWTANGHEAHDMRKTFNLKDPYKVPFTAKYTYLGTIKKEKKDTNIRSYAASSVNKEENNKSTLKENKVLHVIQVDYSLMLNSPEQDYFNQNAYIDYPEQTLGYSHEKIYWDAEKGAIDHYTEDFRIIIYTAYGNNFEFKGTAHAEVTDYKKGSLSENINEVKKQIDNLNIENVSVKKSDKGITISLENIQFKADSSILLDNEIEKLNKISEILKQFPNNDILVSGHTALAGNEKLRQKLSEERANVVAEYLIKLGIKDSYHIFTKGFGATQPIASNDTEDGKAKNRRVEITLLDK